MQTLDYEKITDVKEAIIACGYNPETALPDVSKMPVAMADYILACAELAYVVEAINMQDGKKWMPPYDGKTYYYEPWHLVKKDDKSGSGFVFSDSGYGYNDDYTDVGSALVFRDTQRGNYCLNQFESLYIRTKLNPAMIAEKMK